jgi:hypothetical protein
MPPPSSRCSPPSFVSYKSPCAAAENPSPPLLSTSFSPWLSPVSRPNPSDHGRRRAPLLEAASSITELAWSSASPPSFFSPEESAAGASNRRRRCRFACRYRAPPPLIAPPAVLLRLNRAHRRPSGELLVFVDPSPALPRARRIAVVCVWPAYWLSGQLARSLLTCPAWPYRSVTVGQQTPGTKISCSLFQFQKIIETCKIHRIFHVCQKNANDLSKCSEK